MFDPSRRGNTSPLKRKVEQRYKPHSCTARESREQEGRVNSAVRMIRAIVTSLPVNRGILPSFENGADDFAAANDFFSSQAPDWFVFLLSRLLIFFSRYR